MEALSQTPIALVSLLANNADPHYAAIARWLAQASGLVVETTDALAWPDRVTLGFGGGAVLMTLCGAEFVRHEDAGLEVIAAPVPATARAAGRAVFFTDLVVAAEARARRLADLRGGVFVYNEVESLSGHDVLRGELWRRGERGGFFRQIVASGSHQASIERVASGSADVAAIDSTVLEIELARRPELARAIRVIESFGPLPAHPLVASAAVPLEARRAIAAALSIAHGTTSGAAALALGGVERFVSAKAADYEPLRAIARDAAGVPWLIGEGGCLWEDENP